MAGKIPQDMEVAGKSIELNGVQFRCPIVGWLGCKPLTILTVTTFAGCISQTCFSMIHPHSSWMTQAVSPVPIPNAIRHVHRNHTGSRGLLLRCLNWPFLNTPRSYPLGNQTLINGWWLEPPKKRHGIHGLHWLHWYPLEISWFQLYKPSIMVFEPPKRRPQKTQRRSRWPWFYLFGLAVLQWTLNLWCKTSALNGGWTAKRVIVYRDIMGDSMIQIHNHRDTTEENGGMNWG